MSNNKELPDWTFRGGHLRLGLEPTKWVRRNGKWKREELVPYGKAKPEYRARFYFCPECLTDLQVSDVPYQFECSVCDINFKFSFGGLYEKVEDADRYTPSMD